MAKPKTARPKKENMPFSVTPAERNSVKARAGDLGFGNASRYLLALHEAEQRLGLVTKTNFNGERWFVLSPGDAVPQDITVREALQARIDDRMNERVPKAAESEQSDYGTRVPENRLGKSSQPHHKGEATA